MSRSFPAMIMVFKSIRYLPPDWQRAKPLRVRTWRCCSVIMPAQSPVHGPTAIQTPTPTYRSEALIEQPPFLNTSYETKSPPPSRYRDLLGRLRLLPTDDCSHGNHYRPARFSWRYEV